MRHGRPMASTRHHWHPICEPPRNLVRPVRVDPSGRSGPTKAQAAGPRWRRSSAGFYVPADVLDDVPEQRVLEQSMRLPEGGAVTGWAGCRLSGGNFFDGLGTDARTRLPVPLSIGDLGQLAQTPHARIFRDRMDPAEVVLRLGIPCTRPLRALFDAARTAADLRETVVAIDMGAAAELASLQQLGVYATARPGWRGVPQVRAALPLASEDSRSPNETRMRLVWRLDAVLPPPLANQPVFDRCGTLLGVADLFDPVAGVVGEYDGADHRSGMRHAKDVAREDRFRGVGLEYFKVTGPDMRDRRLVANRMLSTRRRALWLAPGERSWTVEPPPGWAEEMALHERLELRAWQLALYAQYEREGSPPVPNVSSGRS